MAYATTEDHRVFKTVDGMMTWTEAPVSAVCFRCNFPIAKIILYKRIDVTGRWGENAYQDSFYVHVVLSWQQLLLLDHSRRRC